MDSPIPSGPPPLPNVLGLYIHWPYCLSKCPYCDFSSYVAETIDTEHWRKAYGAVLAAWSSLLPGRRLHSLYFGGGTPSLMPPALAATLIEQALDHWPPSDDIEITLEANPTSVETERLAALRLAGVNRLSLGVQALTDPDLRRLGRRHSAAEALQALSVASRLFPRYSFDLIYGRPGQTPGAWAAELGQALGQAGDHLSLYQLTIEPDTPFAAAGMKGHLSLPPEDQLIEMWTLTQDMTRAAGLPAYEIANHARPGAESRHNLLYWRCQDVLGIGPAAHGRLTLASGRLAIAEPKEPHRWLDQAGLPLRLPSSDGKIEDPVPDDFSTFQPVRRWLGAEAQVIERLLMGLRLAEGVSLPHDSESIALWDRVVDIAALQRLVEDGFLVQTRDRLIATPEGRACLDSVLATLLAAREKPKV